MDEQTPWFTYHLSPYMYTYVYNDMCIYIYTYLISICIDKDSINIRALTSQSSWLRVGCASVFKRFAGFHVFAFHPTTWDMIIPSSLYHISLCHFISKQIYSLYIYYMFISFYIISHPKSIDHISLSSTTHTHTYIYILYMHYIL